MMAKSSQISAQLGQLTLAPLQNNVRAKVVRETLAYPAST